MAEIITDENILGIRADEIDIRKQNKEMRETILELKQTIREKNLKCLTGPQIGKPYRIMAINFNGDIRSFVNPIITNVKGFELSKEVCSSIPGKTFIRPRNNQVEVAYQTPLGKLESKKFLGLAAMVAQHGIDHLDGLLLSDIGLEIDEDYENASEEEKMEVIKMYLDSLDVKQKELDKEIKEDKDLNQLNEAIDFIEKVQKGEVQVTQQTVELDNEVNNNDGNESTTRITDDNNTSKNS